MARVKSTEYQADMSNLSHKVNYRNSCAVHTIKLAKDLNMSKRPLHDQVHVEADIHGKGEVP